MDIRYRDYKRQEGVVKHPGCGGHDVAFAGQARVILDFDGRLLTRVKTGRAPPLDHAIDQKTPTGSRSARDASRHTEMRWERMI